MISELRTPRLRLRRWRDDDRPAFAAINADPVVMEMFPALLDRTESDALVDRIEQSFASRGFGLWAVDVVADGDAAAVPFAGFIGLAVPSFDPGCGPCVEIGWRLSRAVWGRGIAPEGAGAVLRCGFEDLGLDEVVSFTAVDNHRSRRVMEKIGMHHDPADDFDHPALGGHPLERHVLYRLRADEWRARDIPTTERSTP